MANTIEYRVIQDHTKELLRTNSREDANNYLKEVAKEYKNDYRVRLDEINSTLTIQDFNTGTIITTLRVKVYDNRVSGGGLYTHGFNLAQLLQKG